MKRSGSLFAFAAFKIAFLSLVCSASAAPEIVVDQASQDIFPEVWRTAPVTAQAELLPEAERQVCRQIVEKALAKYPAGVLDANLKKVYVVSRLSYHGVVAGGTNSRSMVYLVKNDKFTLQRLEDYFHSEFSSILLRNYSQFLDHSAWQKNNPAGFTYRGTGVQAIKKNQASVWLSDELHAEGFLNEYGKASIEEDFNSFTGRLFSGDAGLWRAMQKYPQVKAKADLTIAFYTKLDPSFTFDFFHSLPRTEVK